MHARISGIVSIFPTSNYLIDVGSDHGYLGLELLKQQKINKVLNIDLSKEALENSKKIYGRFGLEEHATFANNDGFKNLNNIPHDAVAVIAGMGSAQILKILENLPDNITKLIFLSHTDYYSLRKWAVAHFFNIEKEKYIDDGELQYLTLLLSREINMDHYSEEELIFGKLSFRENQIPLFEKYWRFRASRILNIPAKYRSNIETATINYLKSESIIHE
ncbi:hypothetical protein A6V39_04905 [Candidatus Mycoplasma haematobovis]|uniref:SAM-dependent methyltransferase n=1 Tax=Candidatus Mycoplasma haematobovis TaxID=432608 RepID=A0A1A9QBC0_9MOLU|nr:tRNA (adenine(22)-N(1))-methyltransferase TrmK [Candidatus Mycoplasma haematobovis]OAL09882.1 hypothetical protein A6V39_04905 [Candidatus Mycoplasma haematobovis]